MVSRKASWAPANAEEAAYYTGNGPEASQSALFTGLIEPMLVWLGLYQTPDPSYGRLDLPRGPSEAALRRDYRCQDTQLFLSKDGQVESSSTIIRAVPGKEWLCYTVFETEKKDIGVDMLICHGYCDYGMAFAPHARFFLDQGIRLIIPDLPSHGRSSGLHTHLKSASQLPDAIHLVLRDMQQKDARQGAKRQLFIFGQSMGGYTVVNYAARQQEEVKLAGVIALCPMLQIAPETRPPFIVEMVGRLVKSFGARLPLVHAIRGKVSDDPWVEERFNKDPQTYHGKLRIGTGFAFLSGITSIESVFPQVKLPLLLVHGTKDRVTDPKKTQELYATAASQDKSLRLMQGYEHVMLRVGTDDKDDEPRQAVLTVVRDWVLARQG